MARRYLKQGASTIACYLPQLCVSTGRGFIILSSQHDDATFCADL
jgi:hypothetical protein